MADSKMIGLARLAERSDVNLNAAVDSEMTLYTVPSGREAMIIAVLPHELSADAALAVITLGKRGGSCDEFMSDVTLARLDAVDKVGIIQPHSNPSEVAYVQDRLVAGDEFGIEITTAAGGACTGTFTTIGYEWEI